MLDLPKGMSEHYGRNVDKMPELLEAGEVPVYMAGFMKSRLNDGNEFPDLWNYWHDSSDLVIYPKGNDKFVYVLLTVNNKRQITENGRKALEFIRDDNLASNYGAVIERLSDLEGDELIEIPRSEITTGIYLPENRILDEQFLRILARDLDEVPPEFAEDKNLLRKYVKEVKKRTKQDEIMAIYLGDSLKNKTILKTCVLGRLLSSDLMFLAGTILSRHCNMVSFTTTAMPATIPRV